MAKYLATFSDVIDETEINGFTLLCLIKKSRN
jgi:hypothetical protein